MKQLHCRAIGVHRTMLVALLPIALATGAFSTLGTSPARVETVRGCGTPAPFAPRPLLSTADFVVTATPSQQWDVNGAVNPGLTLTRGVPYSFDLSTVTDEHPFLINDQPGNPWGSVYLPATYGSTVTFTPGASMPATIFYRCEVHYSGMAGPISLVLCPGDVTGDAQINVADFLALNSAYGNTCPGCWTDIDANGTVAVGDFLALNSAYGDSCN